MKNKVIFELILYGVLLLDIFSLLIFEEKVKKDNIEYSSIKEEEIRQCDSAKMSMSIQIEYLEGQIQLLQNQIK